ncbi:MAG: S-methyl-5-thioribose-1-phosphate isomerase [Deltaproteobacteria bacterium RIFCSPLOWO2_12_FULL_43_16]|nr:MAG: S-methyl-5-thioribose-1-phosphate isomerase [Deltaproteobacteria bacterium RIFCSPHIGHO2_02_FULL_43_33]OGQ61624.1 MAG: S-methyl-5-thioribose-1-phosphate isomerase [Deltaproteobacteria bacterium RIFCSPLOWO2_12_FULL_43_16]
MFKTIEWKNNNVVMIDQRLLPNEEVYRTYTDFLEVAEAIKEMVVRGAPAIGVAAAMGIALGASDIKAKERKGFVKAFEHICKIMASTRPTAVNLFWAIGRMKRIVKENPRLSANELKQRLVQEAKTIHKEDIEINRQMGRFGSKLIKNKSTILTHCNAGALATAGYGTALGVIRAAVEEGKKIKVFADETRPFLQGSRLTAWELMKDGIDTTLITDNMSGYMMKKGLIDAVIVGADRIAANGDVANKIGTYSVAVLAKEHEIPFYVAAPISTIDLKIKHGDKIPIEERNRREVTHIKGISIAPTGIKIKNPAFDVTPNRLVTAIITERGIARNPFEKSLKRLAEGK